MIPRARCAALCLRQIKALVFFYDVSGSCAIEFHDLFEPAPWPKILPSMHPARTGPDPQARTGRLHAAISEPLLQSAQGEFYCNDGLIKDCRAVKERASSGATTTIRIECGAGRVRRSLQRQRTGEETNAPSLERQGTGRNPPGAKSAMGKSQGRENNSCFRRRQRKVAPASCRLSRGRPALGATGEPPATTDVGTGALREADHGASFRTSLLDWRGAPPDHQR